VVDEREDWMSRDVALVSLRRGRRNVMKSTGRAIQCYSVMVKVIVEVGDDAGVNDVQAEIRVEDV
jgi:hypothetical protein